MWVIGKNTFMLLFKWASFRWRQFCEVVSLNSCAGMWCRLDRVLKFIRISTKILSVVFTFWVLNYWDRLGIPPPPPPGKTYTKSAIYITIFFNPCILSACFLKGICRDLLNFHFGLLRLLIQALTQQYYCFVCFRLQKWYLVWVETENPVVHSL